MADSKKPIRKPNYKQIYAIKTERENRIKKICPAITQESGIYVFYRIDENNFRFAYVGQAKHLLERCAAHLSEYDRIGLSLKKRGFADENNPYGWKLTYSKCEVAKLDNLEKQMIKNCADKGYQLYNTTSGGQGKGKMQLSEYKPSKGYHDGLKQGYKNAIKDVKHIIDKHLVVAIKPEKANNKVSVKAFEKFNEILNGE